MEKRSFTPAGDLVTRIEPDWKLTYLSYFWTPWAYPGLDLGLRLLKIAVAVKCSTRRSEFSVNLDYFTILMYFDWIAVYLINLPVSVEQLPMWYQILKFCPGFQPPSSWSRLNWALSFAHDPWHCISFLTELIKRLIIQELDYSDLLIARLWFILQVYGITEQNDVCSGGTESQLRGNLYFSKISYLEFVCIKMSCDCA